MNHFLLFIKILFIIFIMIHNFSFFFHIHSKEDIVKISCNLKVTAARPRRYAFKITSIYLPGLRPLTLRAAPEMGSGLRRNDGRIRRPGPRAGAYSKSPRYIYPGCAR